MPANERMDALVEKATELGVAAIQPLLCERAVLRLEGERAARRRAHWEAVAAAACEQCGRARLPGVHPVASLPTWLAAPAPAGALRIVLSTDGMALPLARLVPIDLQRASNPRRAVVVLSGPEGGLSRAELAAARAAGFGAASLGPRVLRADTAPLAALAWLALAGASGASGSSAAGGASAAGTAGAPGTAVGASDAGTLRDAGSW
jgi:16S rRNA (uracil1498-N3)-methyltransferase